MQRNIVQLRQLLAERFPHLRLSLDPHSQLAVCPSGLSHLDLALRGGFASSALTEIVVDQPAAGSSVLVLSLLRQAALNHQFVALIDGMDSFDPCPILPALLSHLLWVRCRNAEEALKAADLILRDRNLPLAILDLQMNPLAQLRKIPATVWYRWQRLVEHNNTTLLVLSPKPIVAGAHAKVFLKTRFDLDAFQKDFAALADAISFEIVERPDAERIRASA